MNARLTRIKKEVRALFWTWCATVIAGAAPFVAHYPSAQDLNVLSFFLGVPLLATLSLGMEFQHRTLSLWLVQPATRMQLWSEKMGVMCAAVVSAASVSGTGMFLFVFPELNLIYKVAAAAYVLITIASAIFWTLAVRSTIGGFVVMSCILWVFYLFVALTHVGEGVKAVVSPTAAITAISSFSICFAGLMFWLGARKLARFQVTGGSGGEDLLMSGPTLMPEGAAEWFRCQPTGAFVNLMRKEFRLLRPLWLIEIPVVLYWAFLAVFRLMPSPPVLIPETPLQWALMGPPGAVFVGLAGLAGMLSLGEERRSGTQAWHMTLPISARRQWLIKLGMAMLSGLACSILLPVLATVAVGSVYGSPFMFVYRRALPDLLILYPILIFVCFWCACAANGTVRAAAWIAPVTTVVFLSSSGGTWLGQELSRTTGTLKDFVVSWFHLSPLALARITESAREGVLWLFVPTLLFALIQSYRLFRTHPQDGFWWMLRCVLPVAAVTMLVSFSVSTGLIYSRWAPFDETRQALDRFHVGATKIELTGEDLIRSTPLAAPTRRWLKGSRIIVSSERSPLSGYLATIHLASGLECRLTVVNRGGTAASCAYERR